MKDNTLAQLQWPLSLLVAVVVKTHLLAYKQKLHNNSQICYARFFVILSTVLSTVLSTIL